MLTFSGDKTKFEERKAHFTVCVDSNGVSITHKLVCLQSLLRGEPKELLQGLGWEEDDYRSAWEILDKEYGGEERCINCQLEPWRFQTVNL